MKHYHLVILAFSLCFSMAASAREPWLAAQLKIKPKDSAILPPFCKERLNSADPKYKSAVWSKKFGEDFIYINHYCDVVALRPVCYGYPEKDKNECLAATLEGLAYGIEHSKNPNYKLLPLLHTEIGETLTEIGRYPEAIQSFNTAIQKNKKFIHAYYSLAKTYILTKQYAEAEKAVNEGLKYKESKALYKILEKIKAAKK